MHNFLPKHDYCRSFVNNTYVVDTFVGCLYAAVYKLDLTV